MEAATQLSSQFSSQLSKNLIFVEGKGGVGKTTISMLLANHLAEKGRKVARVVFEDPEYTETVLIKQSERSYLLNIEPLSAFEEYAGLKIGAPKLVKIFLQNKLMRYLAQAAPGVKELVTLGKVWHDREKYDHLIIDMPSSGHALTLFQSVVNWRKLFGSSVLAKDATGMLETFNDPKECAHILVALPEEMPLIESLEFEIELKKILPLSPTTRVVNKLTPEFINPSHSTSELLDNSLSLTNARVYLQQKQQFEKENLKLLSNALPYLTLESCPSPLMAELMNQLKKVLES